MAAKDRKTSEGGKARAKERLKVADLKSTGKVKGGKVSQQDFHFVM